MSGCKFMLTKSGIMQITAVAAFVACILSLTHVYCRTLCHVNIAGYYAISGSFPRKE